MGLSDLTRVLSTSSQCFGHPDTQRMMSRVDCCKLPGILIVVAVVSSEQGGEQSLTAFNASSKWPFAAVTTRDYPRNCPRRFSLSPLFSQSLCVSPVHL